MSTENPISLRRNCFAIMIPSGERIGLSTGETVWLNRGAPYGATAAASAAVTR